VERRERLERDWRRDLLGGESKEIFRVKKKRVRAKRYISEEKKESPRALSGDKGEGYRGNTGGKKASGHLPKVGFLLTQSNGRRASFIYS